MVMMATLMIMVMVVIMVVTTTAVVMACGVAINQRACEEIGHNFVYILGRGTTMDGNIHLA